MTEQLCNLIDALWTERGQVAPMRVRMPAEHAARIEATQIPKVSIGGKAVPKAAIVAEVRKPDDTGTHLLWYVEDAAGLLLHRGNP